MLPGRRLVLILHHGALGDFVLTWPLVLAIARLYPQHRTVCVTHGPKGDLVRHVLGVESADIDAGWHTLHTEGDVPESVARCLASAAAVFDFTGNPPDSPWAIHARRRIGDDAVPVVSPPPKPPPGFSSHATQAWLGALNGTPAVASAARAVLTMLTTRPISTRRPTSAGTCRFDLLVHPGSGSVTKNVPPDLFLRKIDATRANGGRVGVILGPAERERMSADEVARFADAGAQIVEPPTLVALADVLRSADAYAGHDSGVSHLAGILGISCDVRFVTTDPGVWRPLGPSVRVFDRDGSPWAPDRDA